MRRFNTFVYTCILAVLVSTLALGAEVRRLTQEDIEWGDPSTTVTSPAGHVGHRIDNTYKLSAPYVDVRAYDTLALADAAAVSGGKQLFVSSSVSVASNTTVSSPLIVLKGGLFSVAAGVTLTIASPTVDAGYYQIFSFADNTANVLPTAGAQWSSTPTAHYAVKADWFGATPDAVIPSSSSAMGTLPTGTDSASAFRRAVKYANTGSPKFNQSTSSSQMTLLGAPNGVYYVTGPNILGGQLTAGQTHSGMIYDGQGSSFLWNPTDNTDAFIDYMELYWRPVFKNFNMLAVGFSGSKGVFVHVSDIAGSPSLAQPHFYNVGVEGGKTSDYVTGFVLNNTLSKVFHIEDTSNDDRFYLENCWFTEFDTFLKNENPESVSWTIHKSSLSSRKNNAVFFDFLGDYSGGFRITESEILMKGDEQILFRATPYTGSTGVGDFIVNNVRIETPSNGTDIFTVVYAGFGKFFFEKVNFGYGATISDSSVLSYLSHPATMTVRDSFVPGKIKVKTRVASDYNNLTNVKTQLTVENSDFSTSYPRYTWVRDTDESEETFMSMLDNTRSFRPIRISNSQQGSQYINNITFDTSANQTGGLPSEETIMFHRIGTNGYPYISGDNNYLPLGALVTSIKVMVYPLDNSVINGVKVHIGSWSATTANFGNGVWVSKDLLASSTIMGVAVPLANDVENRLWAEYTLAGTPVGDAFPAYLVIKYRAWRGLMEKPATSVATLIGT